MHYSEKNLSLVQAEARLKQGFVGLKKIHESWKAKKNEEQV